MALVTLSGVIDLDDLNNNFADKTAAMQAANVVSTTGKDHIYEFEVFDLVDTTSVGLRVLDFTPPDDLEFRVFGVSLYAASAVPSVTVTLLAIDIDQTSVPLYLMDQTVSIILNSAIGEANGTRVALTLSTDNKIFLKKGITYRLQVSSNSAVNVDRAHVYLLAISKRRRA